MHLTLRAQEHRDLCDALERRVLEVREELVHTDNRAYRAELKALLERLERLNARVESAENPGWSAPQPL